MGKVIKKNIQGMSTWAKISLVTTLTLLVSVFMYQGWYKPNQVQAATVTYGVTVPSTASTGIDGAALMPVTGSITTAPTVRGNMSTTFTTSASSYRPTTGMTNGTAVTLLKLYSPTYATAQTITSPAGSFAIRGYNASDTWTFHVYSHNPAGAAGNKTLMFSSNTTTSGTQSTVTVTPTYTLVNSAMPAGYKLLVEVVYTPGGTVYTPRVYLDGTAASSWCRLTVTESAATDTTAPAITTFTVPATSPSLTISGIVLAASDAVGVTGYLINESSTPPSAASVNQFPAPTTYTATSEGNKTLYCWARDAAGNVSAVFTGGRTCTIALPDTTAPSVTTFTVPATSTSLTISGISLAASDNVAVTGYLINESATPPPAATVNLPTAPTSYTAGSAGVKYLYGWARDAAGNVSSVYTVRSCTITLPDTTAPSITMFTVPSTSSSLTISGIVLAAYDAVGVTGYLITESATPPAAAAVNLATAPTTYVAATAGSKTLYGWARDGANNVSAVYAGQPCVITLADTVLPTVTTFTVPTTSTSLTISGISLAATDNVGVTGYLITESSTKPTAASVNLEIAPTTYTAASEGVKTLYGWARDLAGNVSAVYTARTCTITLPDTTQPTVTTFTVPATSTSLTITGISLAATDNKAVTGYLINESNVVPAASAVNRATAPTTYTASSAGDKLLFAWARDVAGNVSPVFAGQHCFITLPDAIAPTVTTFTVPPTSTSLTVSGILLAGSDNVGVTGYLINESATPPAASAITLGTVPTSYTASSTGAKVLFAWVKDAAGNVSPLFAAQPCNITTPDAIKPVVTSFTAPATSNTLTFAGITFTATDNVGVTGYLINESATPPAAVEIINSVAPDSYTASTSGPVVLYAWVKDAAGNVSNAFASQTTTITLSSNLLIHKSSNLDNKYGVWGETFTCLTCHSSNTNNVKRIAETVSTPNGPRSVIFTRMTANRTINDASSAGVFGNDGRTYSVNASQNICSVCHHQTAHHQYSSAKVDPNYTKAHYNNRDCTTCHLHSAAFAKPAGASHSFPNAGYLHRLTATPGSYGNCNVCHNTAAGGTYPVTSTVAPDCTGCHLDAANFNSANAGCADCHGTNADGRPTGTTFPNIKGSHDAWGHVNMDCTNCHNGAGTGTASHGNSNAVLKTRADVTVAFSIAGTWNGSAALTCSSTYCHSTVQNANGNGPGISETTPVWGAGTLNCSTNCHGNTVARLTTGSHFKHLTVDTNCGSCHSTATATSAPTATHTNHSVDVAAGLGYTAGGAIANGYSSCAAASCHADPYSGGTVVTPVWGTASGCAACHTGTKVITAIGPSTGSHVNVSGHAVACTTCHAAGTTATSAPATGHNDTNIDVANVGYAILDKTKGTTGTTCSTSYCHKSPVSNDFIVSPVWGTTGNGCVSCHIGVNLITATGPATGSHAKHAIACTTCHISGTSSTTSPSSAHDDGDIDIVNVGYPVNKTKGTAGVSCSTALCHGSASPAWGTTGALPNNDTCTTCHGTETDTITAANRELVAPSDSAAADKGKVSTTNAKTGAHQTHLLFLNGLSAQGTKDDRCVACHGPLPTSGSHAIGSATPNFQALATHGGFMTSATYNAGNCSNTYCHDPAAAGGSLSSANAGTGVNPSWTNAGYIADGTLKTQANCGVCHKSPGDAGFTSTTAHVANITQDCAQCHGHNGAPGGIAGQQHMDGIKYGSGNCDSCHGYQAGSWAAAPVINAEGKGAHESHIAYLTTKRFGATITLTPSSDQYASAATTWTNVCGICHDNGSALHKNGTVNVAMNASQAYVFGPAGTVATYNGLPGRLAANDKTCSNISCHYFTTPVWSTY